MDRSKYRVFILISFAALRVYAYDAEVLGEQLLNFAQIIFRLIQLPGVHLQQCAQSLRRRRKFR